MSPKKKAETTPTPTAEPPATETPKRVRRSKEEIAQAKLKAIEEQIAKYQNKLKDLEAEKALLVASGDKKKQEKLLKRALADGMTLEQMAEKLGITLD